MEKIGRIGAVASRSANKIYDDKIVPFFSDIKQKEGKEVFASTLIIRAGADLFGIAGDDFERQLDLLVGVMKEQARQARLIIHNDSEN